MDGNPGHNLSSVPQQSSPPPARPVQNVKKERSAEKRRDEPSVKSNQKKMNKQKEAHLLKDSPQQTRLSLESGKQLTKLPEQIEDEMAMPLSMNSLLDKGNVKVFDTIDNQQLLCFFFCRNIKERVCYGPTISER